MNKRKRSFNPPVRIWAVFDVETGHPTTFFTKPQELEELYEGEVVYEFTLKEKKK